jgi:hypothetical protein
MFLLRLSRWMRGFSSFSPFFFLWRRAPQQILRTPRRFKASCATLWWKWKIIFFFIFPCNEALVEWNWQGKTEVLGENPVPVPLCPPQIPHGLTWNWTRASAVRGRRLTACLSHGTAILNLSTSRIKLNSPRFFIPYFFQLNIKSPFCSIL